MSQYKIEIFGSSGLSSGSLLFQCPPRPGFQPLQEALGAQRAAKGIVSPDYRSITYPSDQHLHIVTDDELASFMKISSPIQLGLAFTAVGVALPSVPGAIPAISSILNGTLVDTEAATWLVILAASVVAAAVLGYNGLRDRSDVSSLIQTIKARKTLPLSAEPVFQEQPPERA